MQRRSRDTARDQVSVLDESIFTDGSTLAEYRNVRVFNRADEFLARRVLREDQRLGRACGSIEDAASTVNVNPSSACHGHNLYTLDPLNKARLYTAHYCPIVVCSGGRDCQPPSATAAEWRVEPLRLIEAPDPQVIYDVSETLTNFESAVMLKYLAIASARPRATALLLTSGGSGGSEEDIGPVSVRITDHLYASVRDEFSRDERHWFLNRDPCLDIAETLNEYADSAPILRHLYEAPVF